MGKRKTLNQFIEQSRAIHGDRYDYSETEYTILSRPIRFVCKSCSSKITMTAVSHLRGFGCKHCHSRFPRGGDLLSQNVILKQFRETHGDRYDYSEVVYKGGSKEVKITCKKCNHAFMQTPKIHKMGSGCTHCKKNKRMTKEEIIQMFEKKHKGKYDYSKVNFKNCRSKVKIICNTCLNIFWQKPSSHKNGAGCPSCANNQTLSQDRVLEDFRNIHGQKYDYKQVEYENSKKLVTITCNTCDYTFSQMPVVHKRGSGCPKCANNMQHTEDQVLKIFTEIHGDRYDYSRVKYVNMRTKVEIGCNICEQWFMQIPSDHKRGCGCPDCHSRSLMKQDVVIQQFKDTHGDHYDYSKVKYTGIDYKVIIVCNQCSNEFEQTSYRHRRGSGCPNCAKGKSERLFGECLESLGLSAEKIRPHWLLNPETGYNLEIDYYIDQIKVAFEVQGIQHFEPIEHWEGESGFIRQQKRDQLKRELCKSMGIRLIEYDLRDGKDRLSMLQFIIEKIGYYILGK